METIKLSDKHFVMKNEDEQVGVVLFDPLDIAKLGFIPEKLTVEAASDVELSFGDTHLYLRKGQSMRREDGKNILVLTELETEIVAPNKQPPSPAWRMEVEQAILNSFPGVDEEVVCPGFDCDLAFLIFDMIQHLNDGHKWTFDEIADWLETLDVDLTIQEEATV